MSSTPIAFANDAIMPPRKELRLSKACSYCRNKKIKCDGSSPCGNCVDRNNECIFPPKSRRSRKKDSNHPPTAESQAKRGSLLNLLHLGQDAQFSPTSDVRDKERPHVGASPPLSIIAYSYHQDPNMPSLQPIPSQTVTSDDKMPYKLSPGEIHPSGQSNERTPTNIGSSNIGSSNIGSSNIGSSNIGSSNIGSSHVSQNNDATAEGEGVLTPEDSEIDQEEATIELKNVNYEHHGPGSWLSICSEPGLRWVASKTGNNDFYQIAKDLTSDWTKHLSLAQHPVRERSLEIDEKTATKYVRAYFDHSHESIYQVVCRPEFENDLYMLFQSSNWQDEDVASYALRNAVYAIGCRAAAMMEGSEDFVQVQEQSLRFFFNAFSVIPTILFMPSGLKAVQALTVLVSNAELLGNPAVEYMLSATAARLAQSKGLHRQPVKAWRLPPQDVLQRNRTFWALYCHDKYLALRSGRPSAFDDDEISCELPNAGGVGNAVEVEILNATIRHAQICAEIVKRLFSARLSANSSETVFREVQRLEHKLEQWYQSLPTHLLASSRTFRHRDASYKIQASVIRLHRAYYGSLIAVHCKIHYPWTCPRMVNHGDTTTGDPSVVSANRAADAARQILGSLQDGPPDLGSSSVVAFYYPMLAIINLFIYILKYPTSPTVQSDLAFLDIGSGHFGKIRHLTSSSVSFRFPREVVRLADSVVERASSDTFRTDKGTTDRSDNVLDVDMSEVTGVHHHTTDLFDSDMCSDQWSSLSVGFLDDFSAGDMILLS